MRRASLLAGAALAIAAPVAIGQMGGYSTPTPERKIESPRPDSSRPEGARADAPRSNIEEPKPKCEDPGPYPGRVGMQTEDRRNKFIKGVENYRNCMMAFIEERKVVLKLNQDAANSAVAEFNARMKKLNEEQEKGRD